MQAEKYIYEAISFLELTEEPKEQYYVYLDRLYHIYHMMDQGLGFTVGSIKGLGFTLRRT